jgi:hypothetical protein
MWRTMTRRAAQREAPATPEELELLERHRPLLQYSQDPFRICSARTITETEGNALRRKDGTTTIAAAGDGLSLDLLAEYDDPANTDYIEATGDPHETPPPLQEAPDYKDRVYGRVVPDGRGGKWLQYWFWVYWNRKRLFAWGAHEGDWEMIQIHLGRDGDPDRVTFAQHESGEARRWRPGQSIVTETRDGQERIVVFVAPFSHASYYSAGTKIYAGGTDNPDHSGPRVLPKVEPFGGWVDWPGRWGGSKRGRLIPVGASPPSPSSQGVKWTRPDAYHRLSAARKPWEAVLRAIWGIGFLTYPREPVLTEARIEGRRVHVGFETRGRLLRRGRHLIVTAHDPDNRAIGTTIVRRAPRRGTAEIELDRDATTCVVRMTAYNRLRQASAVAEREARSG